MKKSLICTADEDRKRRSEEEAAKIFSSEFSKEELELFTTDIQLKKIMESMSEKLSFVFGAMTLASLCAEAVIVKDTLPYAIITIYCAIATASSSTLTLLARKSIKRMEGFKKELGGIIEEALELQKERLQKLN